MKHRWFPFLATTAALALAVVAPAQDRGRRSGGGGDRGGRQEQSAPSRSGGDRSFPSRGGDSRPSRNESRPPSPDRSRPSRDSRPDTSGSSRTDRDRTNPFGRGGSPDRPNRDSRPNGSDPRNNPFSRDDNRNRDGRPNGADRNNPFSRDNDRNRPDRDSRPGDAGRNSPPFRNNDRDSRGGDRRNPFDRDSNRSGWGNRNDRGRDWNGPRPGGSRNWAPRSHDYRAPSRYDGRGRIDARRYGPPPSRVSLNVQIGRTGIRTGSRLAFGADFGGLRIGFVSYSGGYRRGGFGYGHYFYDPYDYACVASPWYRYSYLPPYLDRTRVIVVNNYPSTWGWDGWTTYDYRSVRDDRRDEAVQDALDDLRSAFERQSEQDANRLVPQSGNVAIFNEGRYDYSLSPEDFLGMFLDGVEQSKTLSYEILEARRQGDEVRVRARHEYEDSWGARQSTIHTLTFRREGGDYVIREFGSE